RCSLVNLLRALPHSTLLHVTARLVTCLLVLIVPLTAGAQDLPELAPLNAGPPRGGGDGAPPPSDMPETHAASGGAETTLPTGNEPSLPADPLKFSTKTLETIGSDGDPDSL